MIAIDQSKATNYNKATEIENLNLLRICNSLDSIKQQVRGGKSQVGVVQKKSDLEGNIY